MDRRTTAALEAMDASTQAVLHTIADVDDDALREPSLLPGWSRGHVLAHLARNADGLVNLAAWARTDVETPMYASREQRDADIEAGAVQSADALRADLAASAERLDSALAELSDEQWDAAIRYGAGNVAGVARDVPRLRRTELEIHHVDLDLGYTLAHLPADLVSTLIEQRVAELSAPARGIDLVLVDYDADRSWTIGVGGPSVSGSAGSLLGWLLGRTDGVGLHAEQGLPELGAWR